MILTSTVFRRTALIILLVTLNAIRIKAQTKEETIKWIVEKINKYGHGVNTSPNAESSVIESFTCDGIRIRHFHSMGVEGTEDYFSTLADIDFNNITSIEIGSFNGKSSIVLRTSKNIVTKENYPGKDTDGRIVQCRGTCNACSIFLNWDAEPDLLNRMQKAFAKLLSFGAPKETF